MVSGYGSAFRFPVDSYKWLTIFRKHNLFRKFNMQKMYKKDQLDMQILQ